MTRALIIDDEDLAREEMRRLLGAHPAITIVGEADEVPAARVRLAAGGYDLVFLDIDLAGGSGFDLVPHVVPEARIIFVTAHNNFALRAFEVNALDYLLKPVRAERLEATLRRLGPAEAGAKDRAEPPPTPSLGAGDLVSVKTGPGTTRFLRVADIVTVTSDDNYSTLRLANGEHVLVRQTLAAWEGRLPATHFLRVHRQTIVHVARIEGFEHVDDEITQLRLGSLRETVRARRVHWADLVARMAALGLRL